MNNDARNKSIIAVRGIIVFSILLLGLILPSLSTQKPSDCSFSQIYDYTSKKCREKTAKEKTEEKRASLESEVENGKKNGVVCLSAKEAWNNIGKTTCVVFYPEYFYRTANGYLFIDEKQDYKNGFVAFFTQRNMLSWDEFISRYRTSRSIAVYGKIEMYEGHPQIKVSRLSQITEPKLLHCETSYGCVYTQGSSL